MEDKTKSKFPKLDDFVAPVLWLSSFALLWWAFGTRFIVANALPLLAVFTLVAGRYTVLPWVGQSIERQCPNGYTVCFPDVTETEGNAQKRCARAVATYWLDFSSTVGGALVTWVAFLRLALLAKNQWTIMLASLCPFLLFYTLVYFAEKCNARDWRDESRVAFSYLKYVPGLAKRLLHKRGREGKFSFLGKSAARLYWLRVAFLILILVAVAIGSHQSL